MLLATLAQFVYELLQYMRHFSPSTTYLLAPLAVLGVAVYLWMAATIM